MVPLDGNADILRRFTLRDASKSTQVVKMLCPFARTQNFPPVILCLMLPKTAILSYHIHLTLLPLSQNPSFHRDSNMPSLETTFPDLPSLTEQEVMDIALSNKM